LPKILIVDDEPSISQMIARALEPDGYDTETADGGVPAIRKLRRHDYDVVITDVLMPDADGFAVLDAARQQPHPADAIVVTGFGSIESAVDAMKRGAVEYITKPIDLSRLRDAVRNLLAARRREEGRSAGAAREAPGDFGGMIGTSPPMQRLYRLIENVAPTESTTLISGESGTGKELVARAIHRLSPRRDGPFVAIDCGSLSETLLESELFGHVKGAFTGAVADRAGLFEAANDGTVFLDEIGEVPPHSQQKLLRTIQERAVRPLGSSAVRRVDVRILSATNRDIAALVGDGAFREDLYYRLNVVPIRVPALNERPEDISPLAAHFARKLARRSRRPPRIGDTVLQMLSGADWPGNVRQLENVIECAVTFAEGDEIRPEHLPPHFIESFALARRVAEAESPPPGSGRGAEVTPLGAAICYLEHQMLTKALDASDGNKERAAQMLGIDRTTLYRKMKAHGLGPAGRSGRVKKRPKNAPGA